MISNMKLNPWKSGELWNYVSSRGFNNSVCKDNYHFEKGNESLTIQRVREGYYLILDLRSNGSLAREGFLDKIREFGIEEEN